MTSPGKLDAAALVAAVDGDGPVVDADRGLGREHLRRRDDAALGRAAARGAASATSTSSISPEAFFQTNTEMAERLYGVAIEYAALRGTRARLRPVLRHRHVGLTLATRARELLGLEIVEEAVADAIENARLNETSKRAFFAGDIRLAMRELVERAGKPDVLVVDPPRAGLSQGRAPDHRGRAEADRLRLVQPDDARAERRAARRGRLGAPRVRPVDMFPQTPHIECVALLERTLDPSVAAGAALWGEAPTVVPASAAAVELNVPSARGRSPGRRPAGPRIRRSLAAAVSRPLTCYAACAREPGCVKLPSALAISA